MSDMLRGANVSILEGWDAARLAALKPDLAVIGNALSRGNPEVEWLLESRRIPFVSLPELLRRHVLSERRNIVIGGTHGKTTTSCLTALLLLENGADPGWLIGGEPYDLPNGSAAGNAGGAFVIEGDEYDSAFFDKRGKLIQYMPTFLLINNIEFDHADIFRDLEDVLRTFAHAARVVPRNGAIIANGDDPNVARILAEVSWCPIVRVGTGADNDVRIEDFAEDNAGAHFRLATHRAHAAVPHLPKETIHWNAMGLFNARNAAMAATAAAIAIEADGRGGKLENLDVLARFHGVKRRQEQRASSPRLLVIEDFGHHPTAIALTLESLRRRYPHYHLHAAFEPRSNTAARRVFQEAFTTALAAADTIWLAPPHLAGRLPARECLDTAAVAEGLRGQRRRAFAAPTPEALFAALCTDVASATAEKPHLVVFFSNGSFNGIIQRFAALAATTPATP
jgi:UDP-N-acetylmuramate: L-alanyl-gamma-D-glutamyl-meso-diaminopimelate ligase